MSKTHRELFSVRDFTILVQVFKFLANHQKIPALSIALWDFDTQLEADVGFALGLNCNNNNNN